MEGYLQEAMEEYISSKREFLAFGIDIIKVDML